VGTIFVANMNGQNIPNGGNMAVSGTRFVSSGNAADNVIPVACKVDALYVSTYGTTPTNPLAVSLLKNGSAAGLSCTTSAGSGCSATSPSGISFAAGDRIVLSLSGGQNNMSFTTSIRCK
jgi:hypothetical protein